MIADFYRGELRAFRLIAEDLQSYGVITDDELNIIWGLVNDVV